MISQNLLLILLKGSHSYGGGSVGGGLVVLVLIVLAIFALSVLLAIAQIFFAKIVDVDPKEGPILVNLYFKIVEKDISEIDYEGPLLTLLLWVVGLSMIGIWVLLIILSVDVNTAMMGILDFLYVPFGLFAFFLFKHYYSIYLYKLDEKRAKLSMILVLLGVAAFWLLMLTQTETAKLDRFDRKIERCERSAVIQTECFGGFRVGVSHDEHSRIVDSLVQAGIVFIDTTTCDNRLIYMGHSNPSSNYCQYSITASFMGKGGLSRLHFSHIKGNDDTFWTDFHAAMRRRGFRQIMLPDFHLSRDGEWRLPKYNSTILSSSSNLYNPEDKIYIKDNMLVVANEKYGEMDFYNMPAIAH